MSPMQPYPPAGTPNPAVGMPKPTTPIERAELQRVANMLPKAGTLDGVRWECDFADLIRRVLYELDAAETAKLQAVAQSKMSSGWQ